jgi:hypothetical protein
MRRRPAQLVEGVLGTLVIRGMMVGPEPLVMEGVMPRLDTCLEAAGAEFLVLGRLLLEGIQSFKAYTNFPGYDIIATDPEHNAACRIQVKSRWATDYDGGFPIRHFGCDFVVLAVLNRGYRYRQRAASGGVRPPEFYVLPVEVVRAAQDPKSKWGKIFLRNMAEPGQYLDDWQAVKQFLESRRRSVSRGSAMPH